uniref:DB domain-containing protein n=1 Tax=Angiostrongylus cantonensis TaxID=6313 RepID=A0A0K0DCV0_ANGCA
MTAKASEMPFTTPVATKAVFDTFQQYGITKCSNFQTSGRSEAIDVNKLNLLIRALDKTWVFPRPGSKDPVGSNFQSALKQSRFQYKKTCASIFKARHGACQQLSFGVMCFNYCHERGMCCSCEKLVFRCQDTSDAAYCRQTGMFETFFAKYRRDGYKAKAYVHQV